MAKPEESETLVGVPDIFFRLDGEGRVLYIDPAWRSWAGTPVERIEGKSFFDRIPEGERKTFQEAIEALRKGEDDRKKLSVKFLEAGEERGPFWIILERAERSEGSPIIEGSMKLEEGPLRENSADPVTGNGGPDPGDKKFRAALFVETSPIPLMACDDRGELSYMNPTARELIEKKGEPGALDPLPENHGALIAHVLRSGKAIEREKCFSGRVYRWSYSLVEEADVIHIRGYDVTEQKKAEADLLDAVVRTQEAERERFARELHEGIGQYLSAILMQFEGFKTELNYEQQKRVDDIEFLVQKVMRDVRSVSRDLMPRMLKEFGLVAALEELLYEKERLSGLGTSLVLDDSFSEENMDERIRIGLYRIAEDLLDHSVQSRRASSCSIELRKNEGEVVLDHRDEGGVKEAADNESLRGLKKFDSMIRSMNGSFDLFFEKASKPTVRIRVPLR
jgi:PAS domain-containing protein